MIRATVDGQRRPKTQAERVTLLDVAELPTVHEIGIDEWLAAEQKWKAEHQWMPTVPGGFEP